MMAFAITIPYDDQFNVQQGGVVAYHYPIIFAATENICRDGKSVDFVRDKIEMPYGMRAAWR